MTTKYFGSWDSYADMNRDLMGYSYDSSVPDKEIVNEPTPDFPTDAEVIVAGYEQDGYEGSSTVVFVRGGKVYEGSSSHCSCNGLTWSGGSEINWEYLEKRIKDGYFYGLCGEALEVLRLRAADEIVGESVLRDFHAAAPLA